MPKDASLSNKTGKNLGKWIRFRATFPQKKKLVTTNYLSLSFSVFSFSLGLSQIGLTNL